MSDPGYCRCPRWRRFTHIDAEHPILEERAQSLTPRRWKREQRERAERPVEVPADVSDRMGRMPFPLVIAPPGAPGAVRRAIGLRRAAIVNGRCPSCGRGGFIRFVDGTGADSAMLHGPLCPAGAAMLVRILREHGIDPDDLDVELVVPT